MTKTNYEPHPFSLIFPDMDAAAFDALVSDIRANGLMEPVILHDGKILDGRHRWRACQELDIFCETQPYDGRDALGFVVSHNLRRRHLTESQRAMVAASFATLKAGGDRRSKAIKSPIGDLKLSEQSRQVAADALGVGTTSVDRARRVQRDGAPELVAAVNTGKVSVSRAAEVSKLPKSEQMHALSTGAVAADPEPTKQGRFYSPSLGNEVATKVIAMLRRITDGDKQAKEAFQQVIDYCRKRLSAK